MQKPQDKKIWQGAQQVDAGNWQLLQEAFHLMQQTPANEREALLNTSITDAALRERVRALLVAAQEDEREGPTATVGRHVGSYPLLRYLGSGGLGTVYLTERLVGGAVQPCAIKLISVHLSQSGFRVRFEREQQMLASLNHPNITHLLDAGVSESQQPYLIMEFIDGKDLSRYCDERRLSVARRLRLFLDICAAVAYAHRSLIVHLDLKPSNVMVTQEGTVKLLDFGTSKLIDADGAMTTTVLATPAYSSPEQLRGEPVTTACDLYSLGAMLYELLTGQRPFETSSVAMAVSRALQEREPPRITTAITGATAELRGVSADRLRQLLTGDLASIVARCLRNRPQDRYASVDALAEDLRRHLDGRPVLARRQTATYRLAKFGRRHRVSLAAGAVVLLALVFAGLFSLQRQRHALREGHRAEQMQGFVSQLFKLANQKASGKPAATLPDFLQLGVTVLPDYIKDPADLRLAKLSLAESMFDSHDQQHALPVFQQVAQAAHDAGDTATEIEAGAFGGMTAVQLGNTAMGDEVLGKALALSQSPKASAAARIRAEGFYVLSRLPRGFERARCLDLLQAAVKESGKQEVSEQERLWILEIASTLEAQQGDLKVAERDAQQALLIVEHLPPSAMYDRVFVLLALANVHLSDNDPAGSIPLLQRAVAAAVACCGEQSIDALGTAATLGRALVQAGRSAEAVAMLEPRLPAYKVVTHGSQEYSAPLLVLARAYLALRDFSKAEANAREALQVTAGKISPKSARAAMMHLCLAQALHGEGKDTEALPEAEAARQAYAAVPFLPRVEEPHQAEANRLAAELQGVPPR